MVELSCNGICLSGYDVGVPEYGGIAYAHPDCELHSGYWPAPLSPEQEEELAVIVPDLEQRT